MAGRGVCRLTKLVQPSSIALPVRSLEDLPLHGRFTQSCVTLHERSMMLAGSKLLVCSKLQLDLLQGLSSTHVWVGHAFLARSHVVLECGLQYVCGSCDAAMVHMWCSTAHGPAGLLALCSVKMH